MPVVTPDKNVLPEESAAHTGGAHGGSGGSYRTDSKCDICHVFGHLIKCVRCPVAFHKECLGYVGLMWASGPRGKWLCYFCKVMKFGIACESTL